MYNLAQWGQGKSYYTTDISSIPQIFVTEAKRISRSAVKEGEYQIRSLTETSFMEEVNWDQAPVINGLVTTTPRNLADVFLATQNHTPLLAGWRFGLGRVMSYTSDLGQNWSQKLRNWEHYNQFWNRVIEWVSRDLEIAQISHQIYIEGSTGYIKVDAINKKGDFLNFLDLKARVSSPDGEIRDIKLNQTGPGHYLGSFNVDSPGVYMGEIIWHQKREEQKKEVSVTTGTVFPYSPEYNQQQYNEKLLQNLVGETGGRILDSPEQVFATRSISFSDQREIWYWLLMVALVIFIIDVAVRVINFQNVKLMLRDLLANLK